VPDLVEPRSRQVMSEATEHTMARLMPSRFQLRAVLTGAAFTLALGALVILGSRNLAHFDAALVGYTFATLFATFGISYRYAMWLQRPPTRMYWRRGWRTAIRPRLLLRNAREILRRLLVDVAANRYIFRRGRLRGLAHLAIMWGCLLAAAITFPLVWGWVHFETVPDALDTYRAFLFGLPAGEFRVASVLAFVTFHGLVWCSLLVLAGVMLAFRRRMRDHGAAAVQQFGEDILPLLLLGAISITGLLLTVSYTWMSGYGYDFLAILHAVAVVLTLLWLPFGKFFHVFQRPAQIGAALYKQAEAGTPTSCARCHTAFAPAALVRDLAAIEAELGFRYQLRNGPAAEYQQICPRCRRALFGLAQAALWLPAPRAPSAGGS
jgi:cytochrome c553